MTIVEPYAEPGNPLRVIAAGFGTQSMALVVMATIGLIDFPTALFANVGDDSEHPDTLAYVEHIARPWAHHHGVVSVFTCQQTFRGEPDSILGRIQRTAKSEVIPVRSYAAGPPLGRSCTQGFKIEAMGAWHRAHGATPENPSVVAMGISLDEIGRAGRKEWPWERVVYPLLDPVSHPLLGPAPRPMRRIDCANLIAAQPLPSWLGESLRPLGQEVLGSVVWRQLVASDFTLLPVPRKSSCYFCPFHTFEHWQELRRDRPDLFDRACDVEGLITSKVGAPRYLTRYGVPLRQAVDKGWTQLWDDDGMEMGCTSGTCAT